MAKTLKEMIIEKYGSINKFITIKVEEYGDDLPISREAIYKIISHETTNPGIKSLNIIAELTGIPKEIIYEEYSA